MTGKNYTCGKAWNWLWKLPITSQCSIYSNIKLNFRTHCTSSGSFIFKIRVIVHQNDSNQITHWSTSKLSNSPIQHTEMLMIEDTGCPASIIHELFPFRSCTCQLYSSGQCKFLSILAFSFFWKHFINLHSIYKTPNQAVTYMRGSVKEEVITISGIYPLFFFNSGPDSFALRVVLFKLPGYNGHVNSMYISTSMRKILPSFYYVHENVNVFCHASFDITLSQSW